MNTPTVEEFYYFRKLVKNIFIEENLQSAKNTYLEAVKRLSPYKGSLIFQIVKTFRESVLLKSDKELFAKMENILIEKTKIDILMDIADKPEKLKKEHHAITNKFKEINNITEEPIKVEEDRELDTAQEEEESTSLKI